MKIDFSHNYPKLHGQKKGLLVHVSKAKQSDLNDSLVEYDTKYLPDSLEDSCGCELHTDFDGDIEHCHYELPKGDLVILTFIGDNHIPFCTIRSRYGRYGDKYEYYSKHIGEWFDLSMEGNNEPNRQD